MYVDTNIVINLDSIKGTSYTEFYGIGGWDKENAYIMKTYLDSMIRAKLDHEISSKFELKDFGKSLMIYEYKLIK